MATSSNGRNNYNNNNSPIAVDAISLAVHSDEDGNGGSADEGRPVAIDVEGMMW